MRGQKSAAPLPVGQRLRVSDTLRHHHDERRQILRFAAQAVRDPRADAGPAGDLESGLEKRHRRIVIDRFGLQGLDDADVVGDLGGVRQQFAEPRAALAVLRELEDRRRGRKFRLIRRHAGEPLAHADGIRQIRSAPRLQVRLVIEEIELRRRAVLEEINHALGGGREMRKIRAAALEPWRRRDRATPAPPSPIPAPVQPKKCRRVISSRAFSIGSIYSLVITSSRFSSRLATDA